MKMKTPLLLAMFVLVLACNKKDVRKPTTEQLETQSMTRQRSCASTEVLETQLAADPGLKQKMQQIEDFTNKLIKSPDKYRLVNGVIEIPVIVNVLFRNTGENISSTQIQSQIDVLNEDFNNTNADRDLIPAEFLPVQANVGIRFVLSGVVRKATKKTSWSTNDAMKKSKSGGIDPTSPSTTLNMWSCNMGGGILGYAQFPGGSLATDGVVILYNAFGRLGNVVSPFNKGRTATHEVGHWLNLRHIWGDAICGTDLVNDTPQANTANYGCPAYPSKSTCTGNPTEMTMNYMDYTDDACMYMFSNGQNSRMQAVFAAGGPRRSFAL